MKRSRFGWRLFLCMVLLEQSSLGCWSELQLTALLGFVPTEVSSKGFCRDLRSAWPSQQVVCDNCKVSIPCWNPVSVPFPSILSKLRVKSCSWGVLIRDMRTCRVWEGFWVPGSIMGWAWYYLVWITALWLSPSESIIITAFGVNEVWKGLLQSDFAPPKGGQTDHL